MRFDTWNISSLRITGAFKTVARGLGKYKLDLVGVQEVGWEKGALNGQMIIHFSMDRGMGIIS
jgi:exonuclease III